MAVLVNDGLATTSKLTRIVSLEFTSLLLSHSPVSPASSHSVHSSSFSPNSPFSSNSPLTSPTDYSPFLFRTNLLRAVEDAHNEVTELAIRILLEYASRLNDLEPILRDLLEILEKSELMKERATLVLRWLCKYENPEVVYYHLSTVLQVGILRSINSSNSQIMSLAP